MDNTGFCSGTLIAPRVVLTAAHCVTVSSPEQITIVFGDEINKPVRSIVASEFWVHPNYLQSTHINDIALLRLSEKAPDQIIPIPPLPQSLRITTSDIGTMLEYTGFGRTETGSAGVKMTAEGKLRWICSLPLCYFAGGYEIPWNMICTDQTPGGVCVGDSGGPAFILRGSNRYVAGVTSVVGSGCVDIGCSTKVDEFESYINDFLQRPNGSSCAGAEECRSGFCTDGVCCESDCAGECQACDVPGSLGRCVTVADGTPCSDGNACNGQETCQKGVCTSGPAPDCTSRDPCLTGRCDPGVGCVFEPRPDGTDCGDGDLCNGQEVCQSGTCRSGTALACDDKNPCTIDSCSPQSGCRHEPVADGTSCAGAGPCGPAVCKAGRCEPTGQAVDCDDRDPCTEDWCNPLSGCVHFPLPDGHACGECLMCDNRQCVPVPDCTQPDDSGCSHTGSGPALLLTPLIVFGLPSVRKAVVRKRGRSVVGICGFLLFGCFLVRCGGNGKPAFECTTNDDCGAGQYCNLKVHRCAAKCIPNCSGRQCGPDPVCGFECGGCPSGQECIEGKCCLPNCSGRQCKPDPNCGKSCGDCQAGYNCDAQGRCRPESTGRDYLETCGTPTPGPCKQGLVCVTFGGGVYHCLYECSYPGGACPDSGTCRELQGGGGCCMPPGTRRQGEFCEPPLANCASGLTCLFVGSATKSYCAATCDCSTNQGCPAGTPQSSCLWQDASNCWCGYRCPSQSPSVDCPNGGQGWRCENVGSSQPLWACVRQ